MYELGRMYLNCNGTAINVDKAIYWFKKAAVYNCSMLYYDGGIYGDGEDEPRLGDNAVSFFSEYYNCGHYDSIYALGCMYLHGEGVEKNAYKASWWFARIDEWNDYDINVMFELAKMYRKGETIETNTFKAVLWYSKAIECDYWECAEAMYQLGEIYIEGEGNVDQDIDEAIEYYNNAAELNNLKAMKKLAEIYYKGEYVQQDLKEACHWFDKAMSKISYDNRK